jgi:hypothetical protein
VQAIAYESFSRQRKEMADVLAFGAVEKLKTDIELHPSLMSTMS